jgi:hypothetical protein
MNNASIVAHVVEQLVVDDIVALDIPGVLTSESALRLGVAATSLAIAMQKDRVKMFRYMRDLVLVTLVA